MPTIGLFKGGIPYLVIFAIGVYCIGPASTRALDGGGGDATCDDAGGRCDGSG